MTADLLPSDPLAPAMILRKFRPRLLVLGGSGRLGQLLRHSWQGALAEEAPQAIWQARRDTDFAAFGGPDLVFDPMRDPDALGRAVGAADAVLCLAGAAHPGTEAEAQVHPELARAVARAAGGRPVLYASSAAVYGAAGPQPLHEDSPVAPVSLYGRAKVAMEQAVRAQPGALVLRIGNVAGADALFGRGVPAEGYRLDLFHGPESPEGPSRSYIGPQAFARALARLLRLVLAGADVPPVINLALPEAVALADLLAASGFTWQGQPAPPGAILRVGLDVSRAVGLGLVPADPARAADIVADLLAVRAPVSGDVRAVATGVR